MAIEKICQSAVYNDIELEPTGAKVYLSVTSMRDRKPDKWARKLMSDVEALIR